MGKGGEMRGPAAPRGGAWLRYKEDRRTLGFCALYFGFVAAAWQVEWAQRSYALSGLTFLVLTFTGFQGCVTVHNCAHCPPFQSAALNSIWFVIISIWNGASATAYIPGHNLGHHKYLQTRQDVYRTNKVSGANQLWNLISYFPRIYPSIYKNDMNYFDAQKRLGRPVYAQFRRDTAAVLGFYAACAIVGPWRFVWLVLLPQVLAKDMIVTLNLLQHDGCDPHSPVNHSRNFVGPILNFLCFNNGYHAIHHMMPGKHWSLLPSLHAEKVAPTNHPALNHPNILSYVLQTFVLNAPRTNFDGSRWEAPGINGDVGPDEPWHYEQASLNASGANAHRQAEVETFGDGGEMFSGAGVARRALGAGPAGAGGKAVKAE